MLVIQGVSFLQQRQGLARMAGSQQMAGRLSPCNEPVKVRAGGQLPSSPQIAKHSGNVPFPMRHAQQESCFDPPSRRQPIGTQLRQTSQRRRR